MKQKERIPLLQLLRTQQFYQLKNKTTHSLYIWEELWLRQSMSKSSGKGKLISISITAHTELCSTQTWSFSSPFQQSRASNKLTPMLWTRVLPLTPVTFLGFKPLPNKNISCCKIAWPFMNGWLNSGHTDYSNEYVSTSVGKLHVQTTLWNQSIKQSIKTKQIRI